ncbi:hypothetical protein DSO57_1013942 [Entomophthora muscae]|uniref:Uncharacterized protein n=1 Tax=Entomophthora muscae TaxID=34485 RepID=A0ACC2RKB2_9FUNG|nr:hypothetical protein DSO57_1013942 [Entomophthora muscae]
MLPGSTLTNSRRQPRLHSIKQEKHLRVPQNKPKTMFRILASSLKDKVSESEQQAADKARRLASGSAEKLKKIPGQVETAASDSYLSLSSLVPERLKLARKDVARSWSRFKSKLYTPATERNNLPKDPIQDFVRQMTHGRKPGHDFKNIVNKIRDALQDKGESFADGVQDSYQAVKGKSGDFVEGVKDTYQAAKQKVNGATDFDIVSDAFNQAPSGASPRDFWRSVHNHLDNHNHPLAAPISSFSYSPVPVTSLYLGLFTLSVAYSFSRRSCLALQAPKHPKEKSTETLEVGSSSILNHVAEIYAWAPMAFFNILMLELNGYSGFTVFSIALVSLFGQLVNQYSLHVSTQEYAKFVTIGAVFVSAFLNTFTAITGSPVL